MKPTTAMEQLLFSTVRMEVEKPEGLTAGTAFIFNQTIEGKTYVFLVTNKHVVTGGTIGRFFFTLSDGTQHIMGDRFDIVVTGFEDCWHPHPDKDVDVTVMPLLPTLKAITSQDKDPFYRALSETLIPSTEQWEGLDALEEVVFAGYPSGIYDEKNLMPILRRGITATSPQLDYNGRRAFLIDASVFPGSSGSPVLIYNRGMYATKGGATVHRSRLLLLGIVAEVYIREHEGRIEFVSTPTATPVVRTQQMINLGIVFKANTITEAIENAVRELGQRK